MEYLQLSVTSLFAAYLIALLLLESFVAWRAQRSSFVLRWLSNLSLGILNVGLARLLALVVGVSATIFFADRGIGLFNLVALPGWLEIALSLLLLDLAKYGEHRLVHQVPVLWRLHLVHHSDPDLDATTHFRHHPGEYLFSYGFGLAVLALLGIPTAAFVLYSLFYSFLSVLQHANIRVPAALDWQCRWVIVTPGMHRIHHSSDRPETDSNYGAVFSFWDRLFGSFVREPRDGYEKMKIGLGWCEARSDLWLHRVLLQPILWRRHGSADVGNAGDMAGDMADSQEVTSGRT